MRTVACDAPPQHEAIECFPGCLLYQASPRRLRRALRPLGIVFLTACFAAYLSHTLQSDMKFLSGFKKEMINPGFQRGGRVEKETNPIDMKFKTMEKSATELISSLQNIQDDLHGIKSVVKGGLNEEMLKQTETIVKCQLQKYDADKTGLTDYALENLGGCIVSIRNTVTFKEGTPSLTIFGVPVMTLITEPRSIIQPRVNPGDCWAIEGSKGCAVIKLITEIILTGITIEHIPRSISPTGDISSAPKEITLFGLNHLDEENPHNFGTFVYDKHGPAVQTFAVLEPAFQEYDMVEVRIDSNHGHPQFTCIYRIRIHGRPPDLFSPGNKKT